MFNHTILDKTEIDELINNFSKYDEPTAYVIKYELGKLYGMRLEERSKIVNPLVEMLSTFPSQGNGIFRDGVKTRFERLLDGLNEQGVNNYVALWTRYFWEDQIQKIFDGELCLPTTLEIDLTTYCDSGCFFCKEGRNKKVIEYPFDKLQNDLRDFAQVTKNRMVIYSGGGEPTCYTRFGEAMKFAHELGYTIYVSTHGGQIGAPQLPHDIFTNYCTSLKFSIGAATHRTYNRVHNSARQLAKGAPRTVDYVLRQCQEISKSRRSIEINGTTLKLPQLFVAMTVSPVNQDEVLLMTEKAIEAGADTVVFRPVITACHSLLQIEEGIKQMQKARIRYSGDIEIQTFNHRLEYGYNREDYFGRCICHPVVSPEGTCGKEGSITPCLFRRGNHSQHAWLSDSEPNKEPLLRIIKSETYQQKINEQNASLHVNDEKRCPRCRKVPNNIFLDILLQASLLEREIMRAIILIKFPRNPVGEIIKGFY